MTESLKETSPSRILQHVEEGGSFVVVSAFHGDLSAAENMKRHTELKEMVRKAGYGFIEMRDDPTNGQRYFLFIPKASKEDMIEFGKVFNQDSFIHKNSSDFVVDKDAIKYFLSLEERESWSFNQAAYSNRGEESKWFSIVD